MDVVLVHFGGTGLSIPVASSQNSCKGEQQSVREGGERERETEREGE